MTLIVLRGFAGQGARHLRYQPFPALEAVRSERVQAEGWRNREGVQARRRRVRGNVVIYVCLRKSLLCEVYAPPVVLVRISTCCGVVPKPVCTVRVVMRVYIYPSLCRCRFRYYQFKLLETIMCTSPISHTYGCFTPSYKGPVFLLSNRATTGAWAVQHLNGSAQIV